MAASQGGFFGFSSRPLGRKGAAGARQGQAGLSIPPRSCPGPTPRFGELSPSPELSGRVPSEPNPPQQEVLPISSPTRRRWQAEQLPGPQSIRRLLMHFITTYFHRPAEPPLLLGQRFWMLPQHRRFLALQPTGSQGWVLLLSYHPIQGFGTPKGVGPPWVQLNFASPRLPSAARRARRFDRGSC